MSDISIDIVKQDVAVEVTVNQDVALDVTVLGSGRGDKNFTQTFINQTSVTVPHNLNKKPAVTVIDSAGDEVLGNVHHLSDNSLQVTFSAGFTGTVFCN